MALGECYSGGGSTVGTAFGWYNCFFRFLQSVANNAQCTQGKKTVDTVGNGRTPASANRSRTG